MEQKTFVMIITPYEILFEGEADSLTAPGEEGEFTVLSLHEPLISILKPGIITIVAGATKIAFFIDGGVARVKNNKIELLTDFGINIEKAVKSDVAERVLRLKDELVKTNNPELQVGIAEDLEKYQSLLAYL